MLKFSELIYDDSDDQRYFSKKQKVFNVEIRKQKRQNKFWQKRNRQKMNKEFQQRANQQKLLGRLHQIYQCNQIDENYAQNIEEFIMQINKDGLFSQDLLNIEYQDQNIKQLIQNIRSKDKVQKYLGLIGMNKLLLLSENPPIEEAMNEGILEQVLKIVQQEKIKQLKEQAILVLTNLASGNSQQVAHIIDAGTISILINLLNHQNSQIVDRVICTLANISSQNYLFRNKIINQNAIMIIVDVIDKFQKQELMKSSAWCLSTFCRNYPLPEFLLVRPAIEKIALILNQDILEDDQALMQCHFALSNYCDASINQIYFVADNNLYIKIIEALKQTSSKQVVIPCLRIIGGIAVGNSSYSDKLFQNQILSILEHNLEHQSRVVRRQACWILSNLSVDKVQHVKMIIGRDSLINKLIVLFQNDYETVKRQIAYVFSNLCHRGKSLDLDKLYCQIGVVQGYGSLFKSQNNDTIQDALKSFTLILKYSEQKKYFRPHRRNIVSQRMIRCGILQVFQELKSNQSIQSRIQQKIEFIIQNFVPQIDWYQNLQNQQNQMDLRYQKIRQDIQN